MKGEKCDNCGEFHYECKFTLIEKPEIIGRGEEKHFCTVECLLNYLAEELKKESK
jgi:hypothetical protein